MKYHLVSCLKPSVKWIPADEGILAKIETLISHANDPL